MRHRGWLGAAFAMLATFACGDRSELNAPRLASGAASGLTESVSSTGTGISGLGGSGLGGGSVGIGGAGGGVPDGGRPIAPTPTCTGENSQCIQTVDGTWVGAAVINCLGVEFTGPWTLLLERSINGQFVTVQVKNVQEPGFGAIFDDTSGPPVQATYRVCVVDAYGTRCADAFTTFGPVDCRCIPLTCAQTRGCHLTMGDGCGGILTCGECTDGSACNDETQSCCPAGDESAGLEGCVCAPPGPCGRGLIWDFVTCSCDSPG